MSVLVLACCSVVFLCFCSSRRRHTRCAVVTGVQTCALPISAIIPHDSPHRDRLIGAATPHAARIVTFGLDRGADVHAIETMRTATGGTLVTARLGDEELSYTLAQPGAHWVSNSLAVWAIHSRSAACSGTAPPSSAARSSRTDDAPS